MIRRRSSAAFGIALVLATRSALAAPAGVYRLNLEFVDDRGVPRALAEWRGRPVVIAMAYGACRSICSSTMRTLEQVQAEAERQGAQLEFVVVSIDPEQDTPQAWSEYRKAHHLQRANWSFLAGSKRATAALARFLAIRFWNYDEHVMHDFKIVRLGAEGTIDATLDWNHREPGRLL